MLLDQSVLINDLQPPQPSRSGFSACCVLCPPVLNAYMKTCVCIFSLVHVHEAYVVTIMFKLIIYVKLPVWRSFVNLLELYGTHLVYSSMCLFHNLVFFLTENELSASHKIY